MVNEAALHTSSFFHYLVKMRFLSFAVCLALAAEGLAAPSALTHAVHEKRALTRKWTKRDRVSAKATLSMRIGLSQRNLHMDEELLMEV